MPDPMNCPNKSNHVSGSPGYGRSPCLGGCGMYVHTPAGYKGPAVFRRTPDLGPVPGHEAAQAREYVQGLIKRGRKDFLGLPDQEQALLHDLARDTWNLARVAAHEAGAPGETARYLITINESKYWTIRLAIPKRGNEITAGGWLSRDKDLAAALRAAADKIDIDPEDQIADFEACLDRLKDCRPQDCATCGKKPAPRFNCPKDCRFSCPGGGAFDNPDPGGCAIEQELDIPAGATLDPNPDWTICPGYKPQGAGR